jgi:DNA-directed RNA polymerase subunit RPC12/RpoP
MSEQTPARPSSTGQTYPCEGCGAQVEFAPGTTALRCPYCGHEQQVVAVPRQVREHRYEEVADLPAKARAAVGANVLECRTCGARTASDALAGRCQFCGAPLIADPAAGDQIAPEGVLPFAVDRGAVRTALTDWVSSRRFAPSSLRKVSAAESLRGTYLPHWTYDAGTRSRYVGERGDHYWETETYTETVDGQSRTQTRQVRKTRWRRASGEVARDFDDVLVPATGRLTGQQLERLTPWPLAQAVAFQPEYLAGYDALRYDVEPDDGLRTAKAAMAPAIRADCERDIGGDEQRVHSVDTAYADLTFKLMLLPVWLLCYLHAGRTYQVLVNGRTGEVIGQRPYSAAKIALAVGAGLLLIALIVLVVVLTR